MTYIESDKREVTENNGSNVYTGILPSAQISLERARWDDTLTVFHGASETLFLHLYERDIAFRELGSKRLWNKVKTGLNIVAGVTTSLVGTGVGLWASSESQWLIAAAGITTMIGGFSYLVDSLRTRSLERGLYNFAEVQIRQWYRDNKRN